MPLWRVFHPKDLFNAEERRQIAQAVTQVYLHVLPAFYVNVIFVPMSADTIYIGGESRNNFVRLIGEHIARNFNGDTEKMTGFMKRITAAVQPFLDAKAVDWEAHVAETPYDFWVINGLKPPQPGSEEETLWKKENKAIPY